jgi:hypothetical protein
MRVTTASPSLTWDAWIVTTGATCTVDLTEMDQ